jgi:hypothetical protein
MKSIVAAIASAIIARPLHTLTETVDNQMEDNVDSLISLDGNLFFNPELPEKEQC